MSLQKTRYENVFRRPSRRGRKHDTFTAAVYDPNVPGGKRWLGTFGTAEDAREAKLKEEQTRTARRRRGPTRMPTVAQFAETWLQRHPRPADTTNRNYEYEIKPFVRKFGTRRLDTLTRSECREWALQETEGHVDTARKMLTDVVNDDHIDKNPL